MDSPLGNGFGNTAGPEAPGDRLPACRIKRILFPVHLRRYRKTYFIITPVIVYASGKINRKS